MIRTLLRNQFQHQIKRSFKSNYFSNNLIKSNHPVRHNLINLKQARHYNNYNGGYNGSNSSDYIIHMLIALNGGVFLYHTYLKLENDPKMLMKAREYIYKHYTFSIANLKEGRWYTTITSHFTHSGVMHLAFNLFTLYSFGPVVAQILGIRKFLTLYALSGIGGTLACYSVQSYMTSNPNRDVAMRGFIGASVGASDCIFGVMTYFALLNPTGQVVLLFIPIPALAAIGLGTLYGVYSLSNKLAGINSNPPRLNYSSISHEGHLGGTLAGALFFLLTRRRIPYQIRY